MAPIVAKSKRPRETALQRTVAAGPAPQPSFTSPGSSIWLVGLILLAALAAYGNSFQGPFIFDDTAITHNPAIRSFRSLDKILLPAVSAKAVNRRPTVNLSLAVNYALGGTEVWGYHAFNLAAHVWAAWTLLAIVRRTLLSPRLRESFGSAAGTLALVATLIWTVHPLLTNAVTYVIQRTEVLAGLFYLLTLYCVIRGHVAPRPWIWYVVAMATCLLAMGSKESAVSAPLVVLLYDRIFLADSWREVWRRRWGLYVGLAATWALTAMLLVRQFMTVAQVAGASALTEGEWLECAVPQGEWLDYALLQFRSLTWYLQLSFWPRPLILDYGPDHVTSLWQVVPYAACVLPLAIGTLVALRRRPALGFLGVWFFAILAPSSGLYPVTPECAAEKRMYLPLVAVILAALAGVYLLGQRWLKARGTVSWNRVLLGRRLAWGLAAGLVVTLIWVSVRRNADYRTELGIWQDTANKRPTNARAHNGLGFALGRLGQFPEAAASLQRAIELKPDYAEAHYNLSTVLKRLGRHTEAIASLRRAVELQPGYANAHYNLGNALVARGEAAEAIAHYRKALEVKPDFAEAHYNLGNSLAARGEADDAIRHYQQALRIKPDYVNAHYNLSNCLADQGRLDEAIEHLQAALRIAPRDATVCLSLGRAFSEQGHLDQAIQHFRRALEIRPDLAEARRGLAMAVRERGRSEQPTRR
jgi:protein O-mannosyl-transferase